MHGRRQSQPVDIVAGIDDVLDRAGRHVDKAARRHAQALRQRRQVIFFGHAQGPALRPAMLDQDVAQPEIRKFRDVLKQDRPVGQGRQRPDIIDRDGLFNDGQKIPVRFQIPPQVAVERSVVPCRSLSAGSIPSHARSLETIR